MSHREKSLRAYLAAEYRRRTRDPERIIDLRRQLAAQQAEDQIIRILSSAPPLNDGEREHLASLVLGGADAAAA